MSNLIPFPRHAITSERRYRVRPRPKRSFHTVLDAAELIDRNEERPSLVQIDSERLDGTGRHVVKLSIEHPVISGCIREVLTLHQSREGLSATRLVRTVLNASGHRVRLEDIDFADTTLPLPPATYPEVSLPFLIGWQPFDGKTREVFAWTNDRFVARVRYRALGKTKIELLSGPVNAVEVIMYPDINDWVNIGKVLTRLVRPFLPKYRTWYSSKPPYEVIRFEGPYGPPGAPEVILELL